MTNSSLLRDAVKRSGYKMSYISDRIGLTYQGFLKKVNNETEFKASEIQRLCELLTLSEDERTAIFFASNVGIMPT